MDLLISYLPNLWIFRYLIFMCCIALMLIHCMLFHILFSPFLFFDDRSLDLLFQFMFVCIYWWTIFLWYISIACKYLKWKNHIDPFILNEMIIGSPHILSSLSLYISISYLHALHCFNVNSLYVVSYPFFSLPLLWWSIIDLLFQFMFVCIYWWNIYLWYISKEVSI